VMLLAKNAFMQKLLEVLFKKRKLQKVYHALVEGRVSTRVFTVENKLGKRCVYEGQALWGELDQGLVALTHFEVIQEKNHHALVHCEPVTGRTHQIRVHLAGQKLPILGDYHYHRETPFAYKASRVLLHAYSLTLQHPKTHKRLSIQSPYPQDFNKALLDLFS